MPDPIASDAGEHDGDGRGRGLRRLGGRRPEPGHDHIGMCCHEFRGQPGQARLVSVGGAKVEDQVPAFVVAELVEPALHDHGVLIAGQSEIRHAVALLCLLCAQRQRPKGRGGSHAAQHRQDIAPCYADHLEPTWSSLMRPAPCARSAAVAPCHSGTGKSRRQT
jgi:hypothetical protein